MDPPNNILQVEHCDLLSAVQLRHSATDCLKRLRCDEEFLNIWTDTASGVIREILVHPEEFSEQKGQRLLLS